MTITVTASGISLDGPLVAGEKVAVSVSGVSFTEDAKPTLSLLGRFPDALLSSAELAEDENTPGAWTGEMDTATKQTAMFFAAARADECRDAVLELVDANGPTRQSFARLMVAFRNSALCPSPFHAPDASPVYVPTPGPPGPSGGTPFDGDPEMDGEASPGESDEYARGDHVHPADSSKVDKAGDTMTGLLAVPSFTVGTRKSDSSVGERSTAEGFRNVASGGSSHAEGSGSEARGGASHAEGNRTIASGVAAHAEGIITSTKNQAEHAQGQRNVSHSASISFGLAGNTLSSIGFGSEDDGNRNAVETMQDGKTFVYGLGGYDGTNPTASGVKDLAAAVNAKADSASVPTASDATPAMDGTGAAGTATAFSRGDHTHPTDTSRASAADVTAIQSLIPSTATSSNKLATADDVPPAQVNADWTATSGKAEILHKPSLATVATTGAYSDLTGTPTIPAAQVQSNWNETDTSSNAYIQNKPTIPSAPSQVGITTETWTFTLSDNSTVTKTVCTVASA